MAIKTIDQEIERLSEQRTKRALCGVALMVIGYLLGRRIYYVLWTPYEPLPAELPRPTWYGNVPLPWW